MSACAMPQFAKVERIRHINLTPRLPKKCFLPTGSMQADITLKEMSVCVCFIIIKKIYIWIFSHHKMSLILFLIQTLWKPGQSIVSVCTRNDVVT